MARLIGSILLTTMLLAAACDVAGVQGAGTAADKTLVPAFDDCRLLFLHRSVGGNLVRQGQPGMYEVLEELNVRHGSAHTLWHHYCGSNPYWNRYYDSQDQQVEPNFGPAMHEVLFASPEHWRRIFCDAAPQYVAARDSIGAFKVIAFKSGYDNTIPFAAERIGEWKAQYLAMKQSSFFQDPDRRLVALGMPPIREGMLGASQADADSARAFARWLEQEWPRGRGNLHVFPLFDLLAGDDNWLRDDYEMDVPNDSHPNVLGSTELARALMTFLHRVARGDAPEHQDRPVPERGVVR